MPKLDDFTIIINIANKNYHMEVRQSFYNTEIEMFDVTYQSRLIQVRSNRPLLRGKGVKKKKFDCKVINGQPKYQSTLEKIVEAIQSFIYMQENPPFDWKDHPKNTRKE